MSFFGGLFGHHSDGPSAAEQLIDQQIMNEEAEMNQKRQELTAMRISIIKQNGQPDFTPHPITPSIFGTPSA